MHVVIAGSSGFLGQALVRALRSRDHRVTRLVRGDADAPDASSWDPYAGRLDAALVATADVVVNLAGSPTMGNPHSEKWATELRRSRITTTSLLARTVADAERPPAFLAGNGISYYGDHRNVGDPVLDESADSRGDALLTDVTREWQAAADPAVRAGARVCFLRTAPVLDRASAPLNLLLPMFRLGGAARLGDGAQHFPIISLRDWVDAVVFLAEHDEVSGPVNLCCPEVPTNAEFTKALASLVHRPAFLKVPSPLIKVAAGRMAPEVLGSLRTRPAALLDAGYAFHDVDVRDVLTAALAPSA
ncbi:TIGR01777 family oxidoreductase [Nocardioides zeae]|uniref:TIGR01777 family oxidoreductase n=1 Tax=Nocardioides imazamoxiresistens TaxID=3231893 RepID=A0ABU3PTS3_9ACTN|nr:TIGR01777 family oxidoreductase [Nocardioides zeae]MDT9592613.1 TIGR01777 family oxidoreductase [Nocardioides zeae]